MEKTTRQYRPATFIAVSLLIVALVLAARYHLFPFTLWPHSVPQTPLAVTAVSISTVNKPIRIDRAGSIGNATSVPVYTDFPGLLSELYVTEGQTVTAGQPLLKIQGASGAGDSESSSEAGTSQTAEISQQAQDDYDKAQKDVARYQKLYDQGAIPRRQLENAIARLQQAQASLNAGAGSTSSPNTNAPAPVFHGSATITAPTEGIVTGLSTAPGRAVQAGQQLLALGSGQEVELVVHLDQNDLYLVHLGTSATAEVANQTITGQVSSIYPEVDGTQISSFLAHIKPTNNPDGILKPGMPVNARIDTGQMAAVRAVPTVAICRDEQGQSFIYAAVNGTAVRLTVSLGDTIGDFTEVTSDVPQDAIVITSNVNEIKNGDAITVTPRNEN